MYRKAKELLDNNLYSVDDYSVFKEMIDNGGFVKASWCGNMECEEKIKEETGSDIRVIPFDQDTLSACIYCRKEGKYTVFFARGY